MNKTKISLLFITGLIAMSMGLWFAQSSKQPQLKPAAIQGVIYPKAIVLKDFSLQNHLSENISKADLLGHWSLIFLGYTSCPDICPTTLSTLNWVVEFIQQQQIEAPEILFLSVDPERDTIEVLKNYMEYYNEDFMALTGSLTEITRFIKQLHVAFKKAPGASGDINADDYLIDHSSALMLINPDGNLQSILTAPFAYETIVKSIVDSQAYYDATK